MTEQKKQFLNVGIKKGTLYLTSETQEDESWTKQEFTIKDQKMVRYHKEVSINGELYKVSLKNDKYKGQCLSIMVDTGDTFMVLDIPVYNPNSKFKATDPYFQSAVGALENISIGDTIGIVVNNLKKDKKGEFYKNLVFFDSDKRLIKTQYEFSEVPRWSETKSVDPLTGSEVIEWDTTPTNNFFFPKMRGILDRTEAEVKAKISSNTPPAETQAPSKEIPKVSVEEAFEKEVEVEEYDSDKLPF